MPLPPEAPVRLLPSIRLPDTVVSVPPDATPMLLFVMTLLRIFVPLVASAGTVTPTASVAPASWVIVKPSRVTLLADTVNVASDELGEDTTDSAAPLRDAAAPLTPAWAPSRVSDLPRVTASL